MHQAYGGLVMSLDTKIQKCSKCEFLLGHIEYLQSCFRGALEYLEDEEGYYKGRKAGQKVDSKNLCNWHSEANRDMRKV